MVPISSILTYFVVTFSTILTIDLEVWAGSIARRNTAVSTNAGTCGACCAIWTLCHKLAFCCSSLQQQLTLLSHVPQFLLSVWRSGHAPLHGASSLLAQIQAPAEHIAPSGHYTEYQHSAVHLGDDKIPCCHIYHSFWCQFEGLDIHRCKEEDHCWYKRRRLRSTLHRRDTVAKSA